MRKSANTVPVLPIKRTWFDKIVSGEKREEYREIKPYYTTRFLNATGLSVYVGESVYANGGTAAFTEPFDFHRQIRRTPSSMTAVLRAGYSAQSPTCTIRCHLTISEGRPEWGAEPGKE